MCLVLVHHEIQNQHDYCCDFAVHLYFILSFRNAYSATRNHPFRSRFLRTREYDSSENEDVESQNTNEATNKHKNENSSEAKNEDNEISKEIPNNK